MSLFWMIIILVVLFGGGGIGYSRFGAAGMSPAGAVLLILLVLYFTGNLH